MLQARTSSSMTASPSSVARRPAPSLRAEYRRIFILDSRDWFASCRDKYDPATDLLLTYDFALKREVSEMGGTAWYVDHLVDAAVMQQNNFIIYKFFREWHCGASGTDLFSYRDVPFGLGFRLDYWNDYVFYVRLRLCLERVIALTCEAIYAGTELGLVESALKEMNLSWVQVLRTESTDHLQYYFPIHRWMGENIRRVGLKAHIVNVCAWTLGSAFSWFDRVRGDHKRRPAVLVQEYHPTRELIQRLREDGKVRVVSTTVTRTHPWSRYVPLWSRRSHFESLANEMLEQFRRSKLARLVLSDGLDLTDGAYVLIEKRIGPRVAESVRVLDAVMRYFETNPVGLELLIANIGDVSTLVDCVCRARGVPSYLIANGILATPFVDDSKYASVINAYATSIRDHYFRGMGNVVCLGDPRMDRYPPNTTYRSFDPNSFTVVIGASGHNNTDLNSYLAVEFEFMSDVLTALMRLQHQGIGVRVVIKVRANGYVEQYRRFAEEYFPGVVTDIVDNAPMRSVLEQADFFISIYSQTLFEASCLGIPCVYYRADDEFKDPPFDGQSELVTVDSAAELALALDDFRKGHKRFDAFLDRSVMEQYIGPLDGMNLERNRAFLYAMLEDRWGGTNR